MNKYFVAIAMFISFKYTKISPIKYCFSSNGRRNSVERLKIFSDVRSTGILMIVSKECRI